MSHETTKIEVCYDRTAGCEGHFLRTYRDDGQERDIPYDGSMSRRAILAAVKADYPMSGRPVRGCEVFAEDTCGRGKKTVIR